MAPSSRACRLGCMIHLPWLVIRPAVSPSGSAGLDARAGTWQDHSGDEVSPTVVNIQAGTGVVNQARRKFGYPWRSFPEIGTCVNLNARAGRGAKHDSGTAALRPTGHSAVGGADDPLSAAPGGRPGPGPGLSGTE